MSIIDKLAKIPKDKLLHYFVGSIVYFVFSLVNIYLAIAVVFIVAIARELTNKTGFDIKDIAFTVILPICLFTQGIIKI